MAQYDTEALVKKIEPFDPKFSNYTGGNSKCPCVNATRYLDGLLDGGNCTYNDILSKILKTDIPCVQVDYGTGCHSHDEDMLGVCKESNPPKWCTSNWCYVNKTECYNSDEEMAQTMIFKGLYYSYTTCGNAKPDIAKYASTNQIRNIILKNTIVGSKFPFHFKTFDKSNSVVDFNSAEYKAGGPYQGVMIDYINKLVEIAKEDNVTFTMQPRSGGASFREPNSLWTASVTDVQAGISDISTAMYWITAERLALTTFTVPLMVSPLFLFEKSKEDDASLWDDAMQMFQPFHTHLWILLAAFVVLVGILNVWFASRRGERSAWREALSSDHHRKSSVCRRVIVYCQICLASVLDSFVQCFGGGIEMDPESTFPSKIVSFGFGFFVLISISSYTANLTSFLTAKASDTYIRSMDYAVSNKKKICAPRQLEEMLKTKWKGAQFVFERDESGFIVETAVKNVINGTCDALLVEKWEVEAYKNRSVLFCDKKLITTGVRALDLNVAFPVREEYSAGISHYMKKLEQEGVSFQSLLEKYSNFTKCELQHNDPVQANPPMTVRHMMFPIFVLILCIFISCCLKLISKRKPLIFQAFDKSLVKKDDFEDEEDTFDSNPHESEIKLPESAGSHQFKGTDQAENFHQNLFNISKDVMKLSRDMKFNRGTGDLSKR